MSELDALTRLAFLGTAQVPESGDLGGVEGRTLRALGDQPLERRVLLAAGTRGVSRLAGSRLARLEDSLEKCPPETREECPPRVAHALEAALEKKSPELTRQILARVARARRRIPPLLLTQVFALDLREFAHHLEALGERGRWLAQLNPKWRPFLSVSARTPEDVERIWAEGTLVERLGVFERVRHAEPARARQLLESTFAQEKAEYRVRFVQRLSPGLSPEDEPLLELCRTDRAASVRDAARELLARLPTSAFARRMETRAREVLQRTASGKFQVELPAQWDPEAEGDGLDTPPAGTGPRAHWLHRLLSAVPLATWERVFSATPEQLVAVAAKSEDAVELCLGWTHAARLGADSAWVSALLGYWTRLRNKATAPPNIEPLSLKLMEALPVPERAALALRVLRGKQALPPLGQTLLAVPSPWPEELARAWLAELRHSGAEARASELLRPLNNSADFLPDSCLNLFTQPIETPSALDSWRLSEFQEIVKLRQMLNEELK